LSGQTFNYIKSTNDLTMDDMKKILEDQITIIKHDIKTARTIFWILLIFLIFTFCVANAFSATKFLGELFNASSEDFYEVIMFSFLFALFSLGVVWQILALFITFIIIVILKIKLKNREFKKFIIDNVANSTKDSNQ
jgi:hypothetical protein